MNVDILFKNYRAMRHWSWSSMQGLSDEQMRTVPPGAVNSILWNLGHIITDECNMIYDPSGLSSPLPENYPSLFGSGTSPGDWSTPPPIDEVRRNAAALADTVFEDYQLGRFEGFKPYSLSEGYPVDSVEEAIAYCTIHEATHIGINITLKRLVAGVATTH